MLDNLLTIWYDKQEDGKGGFKMLSDKMKAVQAAAGMTLDKFPAFLGTGGNMSKKINSNKCTADFLVNFLDACGARLIIETKDGGRIPIGVDDVPKMVLMKKRVGTGRPKKEKI